MAKRNFLQSLIQRLSPDVFRPVPEGLLYVMLQAFQREIGGECPWDTGDGCQNGYISYWLGPRCRNSVCPGYLHPVGLVSYTSRSSAISSVDNRFDYSSMRFNVGSEITLTGTATGGSTTTLIDSRRQFILEGVTPGSVVENLNDSGTATVSQVTATTLTFVAALTNGSFSGGGKLYRISVPKNDWFNVGTLGAMIRFGFTGADPGGFGAGYYGAGYYGDNSIIATPMNIHIGDKLYVTCIASTGYVSPPIPDAGNLGSYGPIVTAGYYRGDHDTIYTVELIDFWGYVQNFENSLLQICLGTADGEWLDFWGEYFGIERLYLVSGYEDDNSYKARILKEVTRAKGTKAVILEEAIKYFKSDLVTITEYHQDGSRVLGTDGNTWACIKGHTSAAADRPINGANYATYWRRDYGWAPAWVGGATYSSIQNDGAVPFQTPSTLDPASGLWPYQFYIYPPYATSPSSKFVKTDSNLAFGGTGCVWAYEGATGTSGWGGYGGTFGPYGYGGFYDLRDIEGAGVRILTLKGTPTAYTDCVPVDIGKQVEDDGVAIGALLGYNNFLRKWTIGASTGIATNSVMSIAGGIGAGVADTDGGGGAGLGDFLFLEPIYAGDTCLFGHVNKFSGLKLAFTTPGVGGTYEWEYWNGSSWSPLIVDDTTSGFTVANPIFTASVVAGGISYKVNDVVTVGGGAGGTVRVTKIHPSLVINEGPVSEIQLLTGGSGYSTGTKATSGGSGSGCTISVSLASGYVSWKLPTGWAAADDIPYRIPPTGELRYWVQVKVVVPPATPPIAKHIELTFVGQTCRGCYVGHSGTYPDPSSTPSRDKNNCYVYYSESFEKPKWQSGFQEIVDKIKTAGTICIINQR